VQLFTWTARSSSSIAQWHFAFTAGDICGVALYAAQFLVFFLLLLNSLREPWMTVAKSHCTNTPYRRAAHAEAAAPASAGAASLTHLVNWVIHGSSAEP
jgi:hypothetical protein